MLLVVCCLLILITLSFWCLVKNPVVNLLFALLNLYGGYSGLIQQTILGRNGVVLFEGGDAVLMGGFSLAAAICLFLNAFRRRPSA